MIRIAQNNNLLATLSIEANEMQIALPSGDDSILPIIEILIPDGRLVTIIDKKGRKVKDYLIAKDKDFLAAVALKFIQNNYKVEVIDEKTKTYLSEIKKETFKDTDYENHWEGVVI